jgi:D-alanine-D-alanine ligase
MKSRRVLLLTHESLVPPTTTQGYTPAEIEEWQAEYDVSRALEAAGHEVRALGLYDNLGDLRAAVSEWKPDVAFNLLQEFQGIGAYDQYIVAFLELLRQPYTGCNPRGMMLSRDKALSKQILSYHRIPTPRFAVVRRGRPPQLSTRLRFPLFVKSATEDASLGIAQASIVDDATKLRERIGFVHDHTKSDALVEEYIEGRELYVGVCGNERLTTFPAWELDFGTLAEGMAGIATRKVKWDRNYRDKHGINSQLATNLPEGVPGTLARLSRRIYRALHMSGYARMDFRMRSDGSLFVLEANCNPDICREEAFASAAEVAGIGYGTLLERIMSLGQAYRAPWRVAGG